MFCLALRFSLGAAFVRVNRIPIDGGANLSLANTGTETPTLCPIPSFCNLRTHKKPACTYASSLTGSLICSCGNGVKLVRMIVGAQPFALCKEEIDKLLAEMPNKKESGAKYSRPPAPTGPCGTSSSWRAVGVGRPFSWENTPFGE